MAKIPKINRRDQELCIQLLGEFRVVVDGAAIPEEQWKSMRGRNLVKLLALTPTHRLHRDQVIDAFWPEADLASGNNSFHQALYHARHVLERCLPGCLTLEEGLLSLTPLNGVALRVDVEAFEAAAAQATRCPDLAGYQAALALYPGDLLQDDRYEEWTISRREALRSAYLGLLAGLAHLQEQRGAFAEGIQTLQRLLQADATCEEAHMGLMRLYALSGQRQKALRQYQVLRETLRRELDAEPGQAAVELFQAIQSGQLAEITPITEPTRPKHNLPEQLTSFIGREKEIEELHELLRSHRLVTLHGSGGTGKTRLALQAAQERIEDYPDGVWLVELASLSDPALVGQAVAATFSLSESPGRTISQVLVDYLRSRCLLLILDNCEHLITACAELAKELLLKCPDLRILATSRETLMLPGEAGYRCPSLTLPEFTHEQFLEELSEFEAVRLFVERAKAVSPEFALTGGNAPAVARICQRLDGIPLAIELAAARAKMLSPEQIASRLDDAFRLLTGGARTVVLRQQTLRASLDWSYNLLTAPEKALLRKLAVFAGGCTLEAAEAVCADDEKPGAGSLRREEILDYLSHLADRSLVAVQMDLKEPRYRLLETIRQYAREKLTDADADRVRDRHLAYFTQFAEAIAPHLRGPDMVECLDRVQLELDNIRAALDWAANGNPEQGLRLVASLQHFWWTRALVEEGLQRLQVLFAQADKLAYPVRIKTRADALAVLGFWENRTYQGDEKIIEALDLYRQMGKDGLSGLSYCLLSLGKKAFGNGDNAKGFEFSQQSLQAAEEAGDQFAVSEALVILADCETDAEKSEKFLTSMLNIKKTLGDLDGIGCAYINLGDLYIRKNDREKAYDHYQEGLKYFRQVGNYRYTAISLMAIAQLEEDQKQYIQAQERMEEVFTLYKYIGNPWLMADYYRIKCNMMGHEGRLDEVRNLAAKMIEFGREGSNYFAVADGFWFLGYMDLIDGAFDQALLSMEECNRISKEHGINVLLADSFDVLGLIYRIVDEEDQSAQNLYEAVAGSFECGFFIVMGYACHLLAWLALSQKHLERAGRLIGAAHKLYPDVHSEERREKYPEAMLMYNDCQAIRQALGDERFEALYQEGFVMTPEQILSLVQEKG